MSGGRGDGRAAVIVQTRGPRAQLGRFELIFTPRTYQYIGLQQFSGPPAHGPWTLTSATSLRRCKFVKTAPANYTGAASMAGRAQR
jgi:hypothetical protein